MLRLKHTNRPEADDLLDPATAAQLLGIETADLDALRLMTYRAPARRLYRRGDLEARLIRERAEVRRLDPWDSVRQLNLTGRVRNALMRNGVMTVGELTERTPRRLLQAEGIGHRSLREIEQALAEAGYRLGSGSGEEGREAPAPEKRAGRSDTIKHVTRKPQPQRRGPQYPTA